MKNLICLFALLAFTVLATKAKDYPKNDGIDIQHYTFALTLNDSTDDIVGKATVVVLIKKSLTEFELDLTTKDATGYGIIVLSITSNNQPVKFQHIDNRLKLLLGAAAIANTALEFIITYHGIPRDGLIISKNKYGDRTFFGDNWPDRGRQWLPSVDHPSDKASVDFIIVAPLHYDAVANGIKIEESFLGHDQKLTHWHEAIPLATKVMVIGVARFAVRQSGVVRGLEITSWVYPQNRLDGFNAYSPAAGILDFYMAHVGPYAYQKLANVQSKTKYGGLENANTIFYFENSIESPGIRDLIAHEIAHQWFGNAATETDWHHVWLSEGFATYLTILYNEFTFGRDRMRADLKKDREEIIAFHNKTKLPVVFNSLPDDLLQILNVNSYQKGSWVLHMLRAEIGDDLFWKGLQGYYNRFQNKNASTADFKKVMEEESGKNLGVFFQQWLFQAGHPALSGEWSYNTSGGTIDISLRQTQGGTAFQFPLEVGVYFAGDEIPKIEKIFIDKVSTKISLKTDKQPVKVVVDPNVNLLHEGNLKN